MKQTGDQPAEPAAKTLYLDGCQPLRVLRDGPALRVRAPASADRLFPLRRIRRIVVSGRVEWCADALLVCADANIPISFLANKGKLRARLVAPGPGSSIIALGEALEMMLDEPGGRQRYLDWVSGCAHQARLQLVHSADRGVWPTQPAVMRRMLFERACHYVRAPDLRRFDQQLNALLNAHLCQLLGSAGVACDSGVLALQDIDLVRDFGTILIWCIQNAKLRFLKRQYHRARRNGQAFPKLSLSSTASFYESRVSNIEEAFNRLLQRFHRHLIEVIDGHGKQ